MNQPNTDGVGAGEVTTVRWKAEGNILYVRTREIPEWTAQGRYVLSGNDLLIYLPGGGKQLWSRR